MAFDDVIDFEDSIQTTMEKAAELSMPVTVSLVSGKEIIGKPLSWLYNDFIQLQTGRTIWTVAIVHIACVQFDVPIERQKGLDPLAGRGLQ